MTDTSNTFVAKSTIKAADLDHRRKINFNIAKYNAVVPKGKEQFAAVDLARERAKNAKWRAIETLDQRLEEFERNFTSRGGKVIWAETAEQAIEEILAICDEKNCKTLVKSKSMVTEEIHLNKALEKHGIESIETDLGEYIQQLDGEAPYHIVTPAMHKNKEDVARLFAKKLGTDPNLTPEQLTLVARNILREKYTQAEIGVTGANFIISDIGGIAVTENEGNARLSCAFPATHIVIVGIEKMIPSILLDNGRTNILQNPKQRESLYCIRCGACLNACPVYKNIGGHAYGTTYSGPIGSVITPNLKGMEDFKHLSYASSLCGNCTEVCAVKINLHELLLDNRHESVEEGLVSFSEKTAWKLWKVASLKRGLMNMGGGNLKNKLVNGLFTGWKKNRSELEFSQKTFNQLWKERHNL
ncbi:MAG: lactate utilization protein [Sphingobacteriales bacterium]|nr:lactate utilization protein [Sphingobacteriales bacterium]